MNIKIWKIAKHADGQKIRLEFFSQQLNDKGQMVADGVTTYTTVMVEGDQITGAETIDPALLGEALTQARLLPPKTTQKLNDPAPIEEYPEFTNTLEWTRSKGLNAMIAHDAIFGDK